MTSWIAHHHAGEGTSARDDSFWAYEKLDDLCRRSPDECWEVIHAIRQADGSDEILANLAAGPLEDLFVQHGNRYIDAVERSARTDAQFRKMLGAVWEEWDRRRRVGANSADRRDQLLGCTRGPRSKH